MGGTPTEVVTGVGALTAGAPRRLIVSGSAIYWAEASGGGSVIRTAPVTDGAATTVASGLPADVARLTVDGNVMCFTSASSIQKAPISTWATTTVVSEAATSFALDASSIYWTIGGVIRKAAK